MQSLWKRAGWKTWKSLRYGREILGDEIIENLEMTLQGNCMLLYIRHKFRYSYCMQEKKGAVMTYTHGKDTYLRCNPCYGYWSLQEAAHKVKVVLQNFIERNHTIYGYCDLCSDYLFLKFYFYRLVFCRRVIHAADSPSWHLIRNDAKTTCFS